MIMKISQRSGAISLANHLLNTEDNEHATVHELRGFMAQDGDLKGAMKEINRLAKANKRIKTPLVSMSLNPPKKEEVSIADFEDAINRAEVKLGLQYQQRCIVFHEKNSRRHAHVVWSRIDENFKAIKLDFPKKKMFTLSKALFEEYGWELPKGYQNKKDKQVDYDLAEHQQAKRNKLNAKEVKTRLIACWKTSSDLSSFKQALTKEGYILAKGDKKNVFVLVDVNGEITGLRRTLSVKAKDITDKLGDSQNFPTVEGAKTLIAKGQQEVLLQKQRQLSQRHVMQLQPHQTRIDELVITQKMDRAKQLAFHEQRLLEERLARQAKYQKGLKALFSFVTGRTHKLRQKHEAEYQASLARDRAEKDELIAKHRLARAPHQEPLDVLQVQHQAQMHMLNVGFIQSIEKLGLSQAFQPEMSQEIPNAMTRKITQEFEL